MTRPAGNLLRATLAAVLASAPLAAQTLAPTGPAAEGKAARGAACAGGFALDDGTVETGYGWIPSVVEGEYVQRFDSRRFANDRLESVCVCWLRTGADTTVDFEVVFYREVGGEPATAPYAAVAASAEVAPAGVVGTFFEVDVGGLRIPPRGAYVGVRWDPSADTFFFVCADSSPATEPVPVFFRDDRAGGRWANALTTIDPIFAEHRAIMVRFRASPVRDLDVPALGPAALALLAAPLAAAGARSLAARGET